MHLIGLQFHHMIHANVTVKSDMCRLYGQAHAMHITAIQTNHGATPCDGGGPPPPPQHINGPPPHV